MQAKTLFLSNIIVKVFRLKKFFNFSGTLDISNLTIDGLKSTELLVGTLQVIGAKVNITVNVPKLTVTADYTGDFVLLDLLPLYGEGSLKLGFCFLLIFS